jgi:hypothetical protein
MLLAHVCCVTCPASRWVAKCSTFITMFRLQNEKVAHVDGFLSTEFASRLPVFAIVRTDLLVYAFGWCDMEALPQSTLHPCSPQCIAPVFFSQPSRNHPILISIINKRCKECPIVVNLFQFASCTLPMQQKGIHHNH